MACSCTDMIFTLDTFYLWLHGPVGVELREKIAKCSLPAPAKSGAALTQRKSKIDKRKWIGWWVLAVEMLCLS